MTPVIHLFSAIYNWCLQHLPVESRPTNNYPGLRRLRRRRLIAQSLLKRLVQKTPLDPFGGWSHGPKNGGDSIFARGSHKSADDLLRDSFQMILSFKLQWYTYSCTFILGCSKGGGRSSMAWISIMGRVVDVCFPFLYKDINRNTNCFFLCGETSNLYNTPKSLTAGTPNKAG